MEKFAILFSFLFGTLIILISARNVIPPNVQERIDSFVANLMETEHVPAFGLSIVKKKGDLLYNTGYGLRDRENNLSADNTTLFGIGSVTKSFTAIVVVKYLSETFPTLGESVLDVPIQNLAPSYNFILGDKYRSEKVTFRDLLAHRVCTLPESVGFWVKALTDEKEFYYRQRYSPEWCGFRDSFLYNNGLIGMAGHIVAHMANSTYDDMLSDLLNSIGMSDTKLVKETDDYDNMVQRARPYLWKDGQLIRYNSELLKSLVVVNAAGGIFSSANDMAKYMQFHLNRGKVGTTQIVSEAAMSWLTIPASLVYFGTTKTEVDPHAVPYTGVGSGLGLFVTVYDGWVKVWHDGFIHPFSSLMNLYPDLGLGIFTTTNGPGILRTVTHELLHDAIFEILQENGTLPGGVTFPGKSAIPPKNTGNKTWQSALFFGLDGHKTLRRNLLPIHPREELIAPKISLEDAVGTFGSGFNGDLTLSLKNNSAGAPQLYFEYGKFLRAWLNQTSPSSFSVTSWDSDYWMMLWSIYGRKNTMTLNFEDIDTIHFLDEGEEVTTPFKRGVTLADLQEIPWETDTCKNNGIREIGSVLAVLILTILHICLFK